MAHLESCPCGWLLRGVTGPELGRKESYRQRGTLATLRCHKEPLTLLEVRYSASSALLGNVWSLSPSTPWLLSYSDLVMIVRHGRAWQPTLVPSPGESPQTEEPGGLQSMGSLRVGHD